MEIMHKGMWTGRRVLYLSVDAIRANPDQPRKYFEPEALRELAESIGAVTDENLANAVIKKLQSNKTE